MNGIRQAIAELEARVGRYQAVITGLRELLDDAQPPAKKPDAPRKVQRTAAKPAAKHSSRVSDAQVLAVVAKEKGATASQVVAACGCSMALAWRRLQSLVEGGVLTKGEDKRYRRMARGVDAANPAQVN